MESVVSDIFERKITCECYNIPYVNLIDRETQKNIMNMTFRYDHVDHFITIQLPDQINYKTYNVYDPFIQTVFYTEIKSTFFNPAITPNKTKSDKILHTDFFGVHEKTKYFFLFKDFMKLFLISIMKPELAELALLSIMNSRIALYVKFGKELDVQITHLTTKNNLSREQANMLEFKRNLNYSNVTLRTFSTNLQIDTIATFSMPNIDIEIFNVKEKQNKPILENFTIQNLEEIFIETNNNEKIHKKVFDSHNKKIMKCHGLVAHFRKNSEIYTFCFCGKFNCQAGNSGKLLKLDTAILETFTIGNQTVNIFTEINVSVQTICYYYHLYLIIVNKYDNYIFDKLIKSLPLRELVKNVSLIQPPRHVVIVGNLDNDT
jgi:hypothetical protein